MDLIDDDQANVYEMFVAHGGPGFWVRRTTWGGSCARVIRVGALTGPPPYFGSPSVIMDLYSLQGELKEPAVHLPCAGTFKTWRLISAPDWSTSISLRPLDDPALDEVLYKLDKKRHKLPKVPKPPVERTALTVPFERKDKAKKIGAKWDATERIWWVPAEDADARAKAIKLGFLEEEPNKRPKPPMQPMEPEARTVLTVSFEHKAKAKEISAKWDPKLGFGGLEQMMERRGTRQ